MRIAIVKLSALGDIVHAMVALQFVRQAVPGIEIDWVVEQRFAGVLQDNPDINRILKVNLKSLKQNKLDLFAQISKVRAYSGNQYDWVIDAQGLIKSAVVARILGKHTAGFDRFSIREKPAAWFYRTRVSCPYEANTIDRNVTVIARPLGLEISRQQIIEKKPFLFYHDCRQCLEEYFVRDQAHIIFVIGSTWPSRNYPKEKYLTVMRELDGNSLIIWGNAQEKQAAEWIAARTDKARVLPALDFNSLKAVIARSDLLIGNDTGPTHMAWGLNKPSITLFGPTPVSRVYQTGINRVLASSSKVNPLKLNKKDFSIQEIHEADIIAMAQLLLAHDST